MSSLFGKSKSKKKQKPAKIDITSPITEPTHIGAKDMATINISEVSKIPNPSAKPRSKFININPKSHSNNPSNSNNILPVSQIVQENNAIIAQRERMNEMVMNGGASQKRSSYASCSQRSQSNQGSDPMFSVRGCIKKSIASKLQIFNRTSSHR